MKPDLVIARYSENIDWLKKWSNQFNVIIYNKGKDDLDSFFNVVKLPNIGREAHTYLHHIITNYDNLPENTIFLQGAIDNLGPNVFLDLNIYLKELESKEYSANSLYYFCNDYYKNIDFLSDPLYADQIKTKIFKLSNLSFKQYILKYFNGLPKCIPMSMKGCFGVSKRAIQSREKYFYIELLNSIPEYHTVEEAHFLERLWALIFTEKL